MRDGTGGGTSGWYVKSYWKQRFRGRAGVGEVKGGLNLSAGRSWSGGASGRSSSSSERDGVRTARSAQVSR